MSTYLITGSNRGIGLELCRQLQTRGDEVIATCRHSSPELDSLNVRIEQGVDVSSGASVIHFIRKLGNINVDVLIHNAGIHENSSLSNLDPESIRRQFEVNALSPLCFTGAMIGKLNKGAKVVLISSRMASIDDNNSGGSYGYRMSKAALCMAGKSLSIDLKPKGISVCLLHPGLVSTRMTGFTDQGISVEISANGILDRIESLNLGNSGSFWHSNGEILPW